MNADKKALKNNFAATSAARTFSLRRSLSAGNSSRRFKRPRAFILDRRSSAFIGG